MDALAAPTDFSKTKGGWTVGGGVEWAFAPQWSAKVEYLCVDLGNESAIVNATPANPPYQVAYEWKTHVNVVRFGIDFHF